MVKGGGAREGILIARHEGRQLAEWTSATLLRIDTSVRTASNVVLNSDAQYGLRSCVEPAAPAYAIAGFRVNPTDQTRGSGIAETAPRSTEMAKIGKKCALR